MIRNIILFAFIAVLSFWWVKKRFGGQSQTDYPRKPINVVVPYPAGGGSDTFVRILNEGIREDNLMGQPLAISNIKGGSGTIGSRKVKDARPNGYWILCSHNAVITAKLSETVNYGVEAFEPICLTGTMAMVIIVREDAPFATLPDLLQAAKDRPREVTFGANQGAPAYFTTLQLQKKFPGAEFSIVSASGGADRYARIMGGHLDAGIFSLSEYLDFRRPDDTPPSENIRALVVLSPERHEAIPDVACSQEQGIPVYSQNANYWFAPKGTPPQVIEYLAAGFEKSLQNEGVRKRLAEIRVDPVFKKGAEFRDYLKTSEAGFVEVAVRKKTNLPNFPRIVTWILVLFFIWVLIEKFFIKNPASEILEEIEIGEEEPVTPRYGIAASCGLILILFVLSLQWQWLPYAVSTALFIFLTGSMISRWRKDFRLSLAQLALLAGLGTEFVFTQIFSVVLP